MLQKLLNSSVQPFRSTPDARFYFDHPSIESARQTVVRAIIRAEGPVVVLGGSGYGKSLLAEIVADQLYERLDIVMLQSARLSSRRAMLQNILFELKMPYRDLEEGELRLSILDRLEPSPETAPEGVLIIVDEAHTLHWKLIDELRLISNFTRNHQPRVKLLLLGNMKLEDTLTSPQLESFNQRLAARCYLQPMSRSETTAYVQHQIRLCEVDPIKVITQDALQSVYAASEGIPRLVNQLMNHAIWLASNNAQTPISASLINDAWRDLQQLPTPWSTGKSDTQSQTATIEFGELNDDADESSEELLSDSQRDSIDSFSSANRDATESQNVFQISNYTTQDQLQFESEVSVEAMAPEGKSKASTEFAEQEFHEPESSFFAAFSGTASSQFLNALDESSEDDAWRISVGKDPVTTNAGPSIAAPQNTGNQSLPGSPLIAPVASLDFNWFAPNRQEVPVVVPTAEAKTMNGDEERLVGLIAEQQQYDTMGVWENDPPLSSRAENRGSSDNAQSSVSASSSVFGNDFDEELLLPHTTSNNSPTEKIWAPASSQSLPVQNNNGGQNKNGLMAEPASNDYLSRMQQFAEVLSEVTRTESVSAPQATPVPSQATQTPPSVVDANQDSLAGSLWSIDVTTTGSTERPIEDAIEDIVSQLNFSAFSVEPFSVEQIPLDTPPKAIPEDSIRRGQNDQVYMMHRPTNTPQLTVQDFDDDRDLLIVEEEVPVSSRVLDNGIAEHPAQKTASYSQLFARLRK